MPLKTLRSAIILPFGKRRNTLLYGHYARNARYAFLQDALYAVGQRHLAHGATLAGTLQFHAYDAFVINVDERNVATVGLQARADKLQNTCYLFLIYHGFLLRLDFALQRHSTTAHVYVLLQVPHRCFLQMRISYEAVPAQVRAGTP